MNDFFIAIYTNEVKDYCHDRFFNNVKLLSKENQVNIIDNTKGDPAVDTNHYFHRISDTFQDHYNVKITHLKIDQEPKKTLFHRNVAESVEYLRRAFLNSDKKYFFIIESDVEPPVNVIEQLTKSINDLKDEKWGGIGGLYYEGFHKFDEKEGLSKECHVLSGCTVYSREMLQNYPFRYDENDLVPFPDALICYDAGKEYSFWNNNDIVCNHLHTPQGTRASKLL